MSCESSVWVTDQPDVLKRGVRCIESIRQKAKAADSACVGFKTFDLSHKQVGVPIVCRELAERTFPNRKVWFDTNFALGLTSRDSLSNGGKLEHVRRCGKNVYQFLSRMWNLRIPVPAHPQSMPDRASMIFFSICGASCRKVHSTGGIVVRFLRKRM